MFYKTNIESIYDKAQVIETSAKQIKALSPRDLALQEVHRQKDIDILGQCYSAFPPFGQVDVRRELDMTNDSDLFLEFRNELHMTNDTEHLVLYEGKMIHQFDAEFGTPRYWVNIEALKERLKSKEIHRLKQDLGLDAKAYDRLLESLYPNQTKAQAEESFIVYDMEFYRLGFRDIASDTNERTAIFSLLPRNCAYGATLWVSVPKTYIVDSDKITIEPVSHWKILFVLGMCNSIVVDYIARAMVQIHLNKTYLRRIPFPRPSDEQIAQEEPYHTIARNALILQLYNDKEGHFKSLQEECMIKDSEIPKTKKLYDTLRAKNDIAIAKLYGLKYDDLCFMLETFKVLCKKQPEFMALLTNKDLWE